MAWGQGSRRACLNISYFGAFTCGLGVWSCWREPWPTNKGELFDTGRFCSKTPNISVPPPPFTFGWCSFLWKLNFFIYEHGASLLWQKAPVLFGVSKRHFPRSFVACQYAFEQIPVCPFHVFLLNTQFSVEPTLFFVSRPWLFVYHLHYPSVQSLVISPLTAMSR